jgi:hypothetical protein
MAKMIIEIDHLKKRLIGSRRWLRFYGHEVCAGQVWEQPAVYAIYLDGILSYVGHSNTPRFRFVQHGFKNEADSYQTPWGCFKEMIVKMKYPRQYGREAMIEKRLLRRLRPRFNRYFLKTSKLPTCF